jgi:hypothetical protein
MILIQKFFFRDPKKELSLSNPTNSEINLYKSILNKILGISIDDIKKYKINKHIKKKSISPIETEDYAEMCNEIIRNYESKYDIIFLNLLDFDETYLRAGTINYLWDGINKILQDHRKNIVILWKSNTFMPEDMNDFIMDLTKFESKLFFIDEIGEVVLFGKNCNNFFKKDIAIEIKNYLKHQNLDQLIEDTIINFHYHFVKANGKHSRNYFYLDLLLKDDRIVEKIVYDINNIKKSKKFNKIIIMGLRTDFLSDLGNILTKRLKLKEKLRVNLSDDHTITDLRNDLKLDNKYLILNNASFYSFLT